MKTKIIYISFILLLLLPFSSAGVKNNPIIRVSDDFPSAPMMQQQTEQVFLSQSHLTDQQEITAIGDTIETAILIPLIPTGDVNTGSYISQLNDTVSSLILKYIIPDPSYVSLEFNFSNYNIEDIEVYIDILSGNDLEYVGGLYDNYFPNSFEYPVNNIGNQYIAISVNSKIPVFSLTFGLKITQYNEGATNAGMQNVFGESNSLTKLQNIYNEFENEGYVNITQDVDMGAYSETQNSFAKGIALAIFGIIQAGEQLASPGNQTIAEKNSILVKYGKVAFNLFKLVNDTMYDPSIITLYYRPQESDIPNADYYYSLEDNAYMLFSLLELTYYLTFVNSTVDITSIIINPNKIENMIQPIADALITEFNSTNYRSSTYIQWTAGTPYTRDSQVYSDVIQANTLAFMQELLERTYDRLNDVKYQNEAIAIMQFLQTMYVLPAGLNLQSPGLVAHEYNFTATTLSNDINLEDQILLSSSYIPIENGIHHSYTNIVTASSILSNALFLFTDNTYNLLYTNYNYVTKQYTKQFTTIDHTFLIRTVNALSDAWKNKFNTIEIDGEPLSYAEANANSRTWSVKSTNLVIAFENLFYDTLTSSFFATYDAVGAYFMANVSTILHNTFVANAFYMSAITQEFPLEAVIAYQNIVNIYDDAVISIDILPLQNPLSGSWLWFNPTPSFTFTLEVSIPKFSFKESESLDVANYFETTDTFQSFFYEPTKRGSFSVYITIVSDGQTLLEKEITMIAYGIVYPSFSGQEPSFATDDDSFTASITLVDENGVAASNLQIDASIGLPIDQSSEKYIENARTDSSGVVSLTFDVSDFANDFINYTKIYSSLNNPQEIFTLMFLNVSNAKSFNLRQEERYIVIPVRVELSRVISSISPSYLEITQGTTETFSFTIMLTNQQLDPISNAHVLYEIEGITGSNNSVTTDTDGKATINFRDTTLLALQPDEVTIVMHVLHENYPTKTIRYPLNIRENQLQILANPVFVSIRGKTFFESSISSFDVEVLTQDLFGQTVVASAWLSWVDPDNNEMIDLDALGTHFTPYSFSIDPSKLDPGEYQILVSAIKDGLATTDDPATVIRTISITAPTIFESIISAFLIYGMYAASKFIGIIYTATMKATGKLTECPLCGEYTQANEKACRYCGNLLKSTNLNDAITEPVQPVDKPEEPAK